jgi:hypothetical protein
MGQLEAKDMKFGLIAIDKRDLSDDPKSEAVILHFCGYGNKPTEDDISMFFYTMANTPEFGLTDKMEFIDVYEAPESIVEQYRTDILNGEISETKINDDGTTTTAPDTGIPD